MPKHRSGAFVCEPDVDTDTDDELAALAGCGAGEVLTKQGGAVSCVPDADTDQLAAFPASCLPGTVLTRDGGGAFVCVTDATGASLSFPASCAAGEVLTRDAVGEFVCVPDVDTDTDTDDELALLADCAAGQVLTKLDGTVGCVADIDTVDGDALAELLPSCIDGDVPVFDAGSGSFVCAPVAGDGDTLAAITGCAAGEVATFQGGGAWACAPDTLAALNCGSGQVAKADGSGGWTCGDDDAGAQGAPGLSSLIRIVDEPIGPNCASGGKRIEVGVDDDASGVLGPGEIDATSFLCNGDVGQAPFPGGVAMERVSVDDDGDQIAGGSPSISRDGRFVLFDFDGATLRDRQLGVTRFFPAAQQRPTLSADGRFIAFVSTNATDVPGDTNARADVFVLDTQTEAIERVSVNDDGTQAPFLVVSPTARPVLSEDGRFVAFIARAIVTASGNAASNAVVVRDRLAGRTEHRSLPLGSTVSDGGVAMSANGRFTLFKRTSPDTHYQRFDADTGTLVQVSTLTVCEPDGGLSGDGNIAAFLCGTNLVSRDIGSAVTTTLATNVSATKGRPRISDDGRYVVFFDTGIRGAAIGPDDLFLVDRALGAPKVRINFTVVGGDPDGASAQPAISGDGRYFAFSTSATNYFASDANGSSGDVIVAPRP